MWAFAGGVRRRAHYANAKICRILVQNAQPLSTSRHHFPNPLTDGAISTMNGFPARTGTEKRGGSGRWGGAGRRRGRGVQAAEKPMAADATRRCLALCTFALRGVERLGQGEFGRFVGRGGAGFDLVEPGEQFSDGDV